MKNRILTYCFFTLLFGGFIIQGYSQQIDTDSLLYATIKVLNEEKSHEKAKAMAWRAIAVAPDYLDFHLILGRIYKDQGNLDSARYYLGHVLSKNPDYEDALNYLISLEFQSGNYQAASELVEMGMERFPDQLSLYRMKHAIVQQENDERKEFDFLKEATAKFPEQPGFRQRLNLLELRLDNERLGLNYSLTVFDRDGVGPWHLTGLQFIRERRWGALIGRANYANRLSSGQSIDTGVQLELESFIFTGKRSYSYVGLALSPDLVFPQQRYGYSFHQILPSAWEWEAGLRYTSVAPPEGRRDFRSVVLGGGKYIGSGWINLRTFLQNEEDQFYPAFTLTYRYYLNTRFDYFTLIGGYGTSPDERQTLGQFDNRVALDSYRAGGGYYRLFGNRWVTGAQLMYNYQEYHPGRTQNELEFFLSLQLKF